MPSLEADRFQSSSTPYKTLKDDPKYDQIKRLIENLPPDKMSLLDNYIKRLSSDSSSSKSCPWV
ncbi:MAG: hypothetical protein PHS86_08115 [Syntrophaceae bacterium]|nr:hypothetical protein [Syntrophaceae bacterium]